MGNTKIMVNTVIGLIGAGITAALGGWDMALRTLFGFMAADYITGLIVAGVFKRSAKTAGGRLSSAAGLQGLFKKGGMLLLVYIACRLDAMTGTDYMRDAAVIALVLNEAVSITENLGLMGVPIPGVIIKAIEVLKTKERTGSEDQ
ncbi:MAG: holin family protein [Candidatus Fimivivens sp.]